MGLFRRSKPKELTAQEEVKILSKVVNKSRSKIPSIPVAKYSNPNKPRSAIIQGGWNIERNPASIAMIDEIRRIKLDPEFKRSLDGYERKMGMLRKVMQGLVTSSSLQGLMLYGAPGCGKSWTMLSALDEMKKKGAKLDYHVIKGKITPLQLYEFVKKHPKSTDINIFDDCDSIFFDTESMNLVKAMADTYPERVISYRSKAASDPQFTYRGKLICITNQNLNGSEHFDALKDRMPLYTLEITFPEKFAKSIDVTISNPKYLHDTKYKEAADYVITFMNNNMAAFNIPQYSLRTVIRLIGIYELVGQEDFELYVRGMKEFNWRSVPISST